MDVIPQMLCLFHSENIGRRRWHVGTRLSLYAQNSVSSGGVTVTSLGGQWGAVVCSQGPRLAAGAPFAPFCGGLEADGECGQCSRWLLSSGSVHSSSVQDGLYRGRPPLRTCLLVTIPPCSSSALFVWALGVLCPFPAATPLTVPFQLHGEAATSPVDRNEHQSRLSFQSSKLIKLATLCKTGWFIPVSSLGVGRHRCC